MEIRYNDSWMKLCDKKWTAEDAKVICRMLGSVEPSVRSLAASYFGEGTGNVLMVIIILIHIQNFKFRFLFAPKYASFFLISFVHKGPGVNGE